LGLPCAGRCRDSWPAHRGVTPGPAQGEDSSSSASNCSSQERRPVTRESPRRPAVGSLPGRGGGDPCSATAPHFLASLAGGRAEGAPASTVLASGGTGYSRASRVSPPGTCSAECCGVLPGGCGAALPCMSEGASLSASGARSWRRYAMSGLDEL